MIHRNALICGLWNIEVANSVAVGDNFPVSCPSFKAYRSHTETFFHSVGIGLQAYDLLIVQDAVESYRISPAGSMQFP